MRLSILDQSAATSGRTAAAAIRDTMGLASFADELGYHRFWVSEHHNHEAIVGTAPEVLLGAIAATTHRIRLGSAGVMLPHYSALKVAEQFRVLEALAPGRIDLGLGRAPGSDGLTAYALNPNADRAADQFPTQVRDLSAWVAGLALPADHPFRSVRAHPMGPTSPEIWILGSSDYGAQLAAHFGLPYCFAHFFTDGRGVERAMELYRQLYRPSDGHPTPNAALCVWALAADSEEEARHHFFPRAVWRVLRDRGQLAALPSFEEARATALTPAETERVARMAETAFIGTPDRVASRLADLATGLNVQELAIVTWAHDLDARRHSYRLLAGAFGLHARAPGLDQAA